MQSQDRRGPDRGGPHPGRVSFFASVPQRQQIECYVSPLLLLRVYFPLMFPHAFPHLLQLLSMSREKSDRLARLHSRVHWLDSYNATLATRLEEADAGAEQVTTLEACIRELEQELARATGERDAQRAAADQKA